MEGARLLLDEIACMRGVQAVSLVDYVSRFLLYAVRGTRGPDLDKAADVDTDVVRAKLAALEQLGYQPERLEDIVVTLDDEVHVMRPLNQRQHQGVFLYLVLDRRRADLAAVRAKMREVELRLDL